MLCHWVEAFKRKPLQTCGVVAFKPHVCNSCLFPRLPITPPLSYFYNITFSVKCYRLHVSTFFKIGRGCKKILIQIQHWFFNHLHQVNSGTTQSPDTLATIGRHYFPLFGICNVHAANPCGSTTVTGINQKTITLPTHMPNYITSIQLLNIG
jgi:hypothetical protein